MKIVQRPYDLDAMVEELVRNPLAAMTGAARISGHDKEMMVEARIDHGRWLADCPSCDGAELVSKRDPRFYCLSCFNLEYGHRSLAVMFPPDADEIEAALLERPHPRYMHWRPGETAERLRAEHERMRGR